MIGRRARLIGARFSTVGAPRHRLEELLWTSRRGARWLLRRDLYRLYRYRASRTPPALGPFESSTFSQNGEDGIIGHITSQMGIESGVFAEIGAADGSENCTRLLAERGWHGVWIEADPDLAAVARSLQLGARVRVVQSLVSARNVIAILRDAGTPNDLDVLCIDIDSGNYQVTEQVLQEFTPKLLVVEVNGEHHWDWIQTRRTSEEWDGSWNYGASLRAYERLARLRGYCLIGCDSVGVNAFFVRSDMARAGMTIGDGRDHYVPPSHRPGLVGHPRRPLRSLRSDEPWSVQELASVVFEDVALIGPPTRRCGESVNVLVTVVNPSTKAISAAGACPIHLAGRILDSERNEVGESDPIRSALAKVVPPGRRAPASIELRLPDRPGRVTVVPTIVQEGVGWRPVTVSEGVSVTVI